MQNLFRAAVFLFAGLLSNAGFAAEHGSKTEAVAMVQKAIAYLKANGKEKAFAEINQPKGQFIDRDLYVVVYDMKGKNLAHGGNAKMIGKDLIDMKDVEGKPFMKERVELMKNQATAWQDYSFPNPVSKKIEHKTMYLEKVEDLIFGAGVYK